MLQFWCHHTNLRSRSHLVLYAGCVSPLLSSAYWCWGAPRSSHQVRSSLAASHCAFTLLRLIGSSSAKSCLLCMPHFRQSRLTAWHLFNASKEQGATSAQHSAMLLSLRAADFGDDMLGLVNQARRQAGARPLRYSHELETAAHRHSADIARTGRMGHTGGLHGTSDGIARPAEPSLRITLGVPFVWIGLCPPS